MKINRAFQLFAISGLLIFTACGCSGDNAEPVPTAQTLTTPMNTPLTITLSGTDVDDSELSFVVMTQPKHGKLSDESPTVTYTPDLDYAGEDSFTFAADDGNYDSGGISAPATVTITVVNAAPPTDLSLFSSSLAENQPTGTVVGTLSAEDEDNDTLTYSLVSGEGDSDNASFSIDGNQLKAQAAFDFEAKNSYSVRVQVSDGGNVLAESFTVTVTNVDEPATDLTLSSAEVEELQPIGAGVGTLGNNDPEDDSTLSYSLVEGEGDTDNATFKIEDGELQTNDFLDFETKNSYSVRVQGVGEGVSLAKSFTISVTNLDDTAPNLDWTDPGTLAVGEPVTLSGTVTDDPTDIDSGVATVGVYIDTIPEDDSFDEANKLGDATLSGDTWSFTYTPDASGDVNLAVLARDGSELANGAAFYRTVIVEEDDTPN